MKLFLNGKLIWENPSELGHFGIKLRKQVLEDAIIERMFQRAAEAKKVSKNVTGADNQQGRPSTLR